MSVEPHRPGPLVCGTFSEIIAPRKGKGPWQRSGRRKRNMALRV
ncbi:unnamed protein product [Ciceribacter selenitireducens ATCC BAA-1503]|uniref:Uncharacterized protein n=1 Tax=Ciceribacter selenitireducens ATCC BAA-1503 TaxID=1336235 RepID=A0A376AJI3_9HYPH|nr:unnamed protein product [Ciceribacter selenitireducens ATCC BAA-1503]